MKFFKPLLSILLTFLLYSFQLQAQHTPDPHKSGKDHGYRHFRCSVVLDHTYIGTETLKGKDYLVVPAIGLDAEYWFNGKWGVGLHNDIELITYEVRREGAEHLFERHAPLLLTVDGLWKPAHHFVFLIGPGVELEEHETLLVLRGGVEYEIELSSHWDISPTIFYDTRLHAYDTFSVGIGIGKRF